VDRQIDPSLLTGSEEEKIRDVTIEMNGAIERAIRRHPSQWPWMHSRWHSTPEIVERRLRVRARRSLEGEAEEA
jgi:KDO2-lipid IV(A) lauroyltransferase